MIVFGKFFFVPRPAPNTAPKFHSEPRHQRNDRESYADIIRQKDPNQANKTSSDDMKNMKMLQQIMQQLMTVTNLLINILPNSNQVSLKP